LYLDKSDVKRHNVYLLQSAEFQASARFTRFDALQPTTLACRALDGTTALLVCQRITYLLKDCASSAQQTRETTRLPPPRKATFAGRQHGWQATAAACLMNINAARRSSSEWQQTVTSHEAKTRLPLPQSVRMIDVSRWSLWALSQPARIVASCWPWSVWTARGPDHDCLAGARDCRLPCRGLLIPPLSLRRFGRLSITWNQWHTYVSI